jgi:hypothetical protein
MIAHVESHALISRHRAFCKLATQLFKKRGKPHKVYKKALEFIGHVRPCGLDRSRVVES